MLSGISITCFAASYAVALTLEISRVFFRPLVRRYVSWIFMVLGLFTHTSYLVFRAQEGYSLRGTPLSNWYHWCLVAAWLVATCYLLISFSRPTTTSGVFLLPLVLALIGVACLFPRDQVFPISTGHRVWGSIHGATWTLGTATVTIGFAAGIMYLLQSYRLKRKIPMKTGFRLPNLEWLRKLNERSLVVSAVFLAAGLLSGIMMNLIRRDGQEVGFPWTDPVVWTSGLLFLWLAVAAVFSHLYKPARLGWKVAYLTVASFVFLILVLGIVFLSSTQHTRERPGDSNSNQIEQSAAQSHSMNPLRMAVRRRYGTERFSAQRGSANLPTEAQSP